MASPSMTDQGCHKVAPHDSHGSRGQAPVLTALAKRHSTRYDSGEQTELGFSRSLNIHTNAIENTVQYCMRKTRNLNKNFWPWKWSVVQAEDRGTTEIKAHAPRPNGGVYNRVSLFVRSKINLGVIYHTV